MAQHLLYGTNLTPGMIPKASTSNVLIDSTFSEADLARGKQYRQFTFVVSGGDFSFIKTSDGKPVMVLQDLE